MADSAKESMEVAEAARETEWKHPSFVAELFMGRFRPDLIFPFPEQEPGDRKACEDFLVVVEKFMREKVDADAIDRTGDYPREILKGLADIGAMSIKMPKEYGGMGLSQMTYNRTIAMVASHCASTAVWMSGHQSIGVPQPLKFFGTPEQKKKYFPRLAKGAISAFALTEPNVGSDPAKMECTATPTEDGKHYLLNGTKLWCTNGPWAEILIVMARTPNITVRGKEKKQITAFIVEGNWPGIEVVHRCRFMGLNGIQNGLLKFTNVKVPAENILMGTGQGLKLALITLNTGRLTLPAACVGVAKKCLEVARVWANERVQWGAPVGRHEAISAKLAMMSSHTFAMEAMTWYATQLVDKGGADIRIEAAMAKLFVSEWLWKVLDETIQIRGGRGYENADSLRARGEHPFPVERMMRDSRINTIIEGASEIMRLFLAREALDGHMRMAGALINPKASLGEKASALAKTGFFYAHWYPRQWVNLDWLGFYDELGYPLSDHVRYVGLTSHKLARSVLHFMVASTPLALKYGPEGPGRRQLALGRLVNVGVDLFAMAAVCSRAQMLMSKNPDDTTPRDLADHFCRSARRRIAQEFATLFRNDDALARDLAGDFLDGKHAWLEKGIVGNL